MKQVIKTLFILLNICITTTAYCQNQKPDANNALLYFTIKSTESQSIETNVYFYSVSNTNEIVTTTNSLGEGSVLLPNAAIYSVYIGLSDNKYDIQIPKYPNLQFKQDFIFDISKPDELHPSPTPTLYT